MLSESRDFTLERTQVLAGTPGEIFTFFIRARNLEAITPGWLRFHIVEAPAELALGSILRYRLRVFGFPIRWKTEIVDWRPPRTFVDVQLSGPYPLWVHTHRFTPVKGGVEVFDHVRYRVPGGPVAARIQRRIVGPWLDEIFGYRADRLAERFGASRRAGTSASNEVSEA